MASSKRCDNHCHSLASLATSTRPSGRAPIPVGTFIATATPPEQIAPLAREAEQLGYSEVWVAEDYFCYGGFAASALALQATRGVSVGLGIVASVARHPAVTAMEIATLARTYPGRFLPGIGHGVPFWTDQLGLTPPSPSPTRPRSPSRS